MKPFKSFIALLVLVSACTPKKLDNNIHDEAPVYEQSVALETRNVKSELEVDSLVKLLYPEVKSEDMEKIIPAISQMESYILNLDNLENPAIHFEGKLAPAYRRMMDLYGYALSLGISQDSHDERFLTQLNNYRATIFKSCHLDNQTCENVAPFKGPYGVTVLNHLLSQDVERIEKQKQRPQFQQVKNVVFALYVLKNFREVRSNLTGDIFIRFSSTFFRAIKINSNNDKDKVVREQFLNDSLLKNYLADLQNIMVKQSQEEASPSSCSIFQSVDPLLLEEINTNLKPGFVSQLTSHFYKCTSPEIINQKIIEIEKTKQAKAQKNIDELGAWSKAHNDFHSRSYILRNESKKTLKNFNVNKELPLNRIYFLDRVFYGKVSLAERGASLDRFSQEELLEFIDQTEQFAQENFIYSMNYTFNVFNRALEVSYKESGGIDKDFVQNVYDSLWERTGDIWIDYKENVTRLKIALGDVFVRLNPENRAAFKDRIDSLRDNKLEKIAIDKLINLSVSYPIVLATNYIVGQDGGGTMKIRVSWADWLDNSVEISTANPLRDYFSAFSRTSLQLLDFGFLSYAPNEIEKSMGLSMAIKTGFFDTVNLDLGNENQGKLHNLALFFERYIEHNEQWATHSTNKIEDIKKIQDNHWPKIKRLCQAPISAQRKIMLRSVYQDFIMYSSEAEPTITGSDLEYVNRVRNITNSVRTLKNEIDQLKRTYRVIVEALKETGGVDSLFKKKLESYFLPHFKIYKEITNLQKTMLKDVGSKDYKCLAQLETLQRFQQNILQRNTVKYLAKVHAAMKMLRDINIAQGSSPTQSLKDYAELNKSNPMLVELASEISTSGVVDKIITANPSLGNSSRRVLQKAVEFTLLPTNYDGDLGYSITGMSIKTKDLSDSTNFLLPRGGISASKFTISPQDQFFRVREELLSMTASAGQLRFYFGDLLMEEVKDSISDDEEISLNPNMSIEINNLKFYKDDLAKQERSKHEVRYIEDLGTFVQRGLEKFYGSYVLHQGRQVFNYSSATTQSDRLNTLLKKDLSEYKDGPHFIPSSVKIGDSSTSQVSLSCYLDQGFDHIETPKGCDKLEITPKELISKHLYSLDRQYYEVDELFPILEGDDVTSDLVNQSYLDNRYIDQYKPSAILSSFRYYKYKDEPKRWTWFDQYVARNFTTVTGLDNSDNVVTTGRIPGATRFEMYSEDVLKARYDEQLLELNKSPMSIMRNFYRAPVIKSLMLTDKVIDQIIDMEYNNKEDDFPKIAIRNKDINDQNSSKIWDWVDININKRSDGSLILLRRNDMETSQHIAQQKTVFREYQCGLLPQEGDADFNLATSQSIEKAGTECAKKVEVWMENKQCDLTKQRNEKNSAYPVKCQQGNGGE